jgi:hypothetical protein
VLNPVVLEQYMRTEAFGPNILQEAEKQVRMVGKNL